MFHIYRTPFPRSSNTVGLRLGPARNTRETEGSVVTISRPRGYLGVGRDTFLIDGKAPVGVAAGWPTSDRGEVRVPDGPRRAVKVVFNRETLTVQSWPADGHIVIAEFH